MHRQIVVALVIFLLSVATQAAPRITYDRQCVTIDGRDTFIYSGAFHYFRCPKELWRDRFARMKSAGLNTVETYVAWNWHEPQMPASLDDYSKLDLTDLDDWLTMATDEFGLNVILRPGPYICAEWDGGGYPQWLPTKRPADFPKDRMWLRGNDRAYLDWCKHWMDAVAKAARPHQITQRPAGKAGVILYQIENEYDYASQPDDVKIGEITALAHWSRDAGIDVPLITCVTSKPNFAADPFIKENVVETRNVYPGYDLNGMRSHFDVLAKYQPDKFRAITELQGGWFSNVGGRLSAAQGFGPEQIRHITLFAIERGFTSLNYYMFFGGTNFGDRAARGITTTYDYDAPLREPGGVTERYAAVSGIGQMLKGHGPRLARSEIVPCDVSGDDAPKDVTFVMRQAKDGARYVFVRTEERNGDRAGSVTLKPKDGKGGEIRVDYSLPPFGAAVLYVPADGGKSEWLPKAVDLPQRPAAGELPAPIKLNDIAWRDEPMPDQWQAVSKGEMLEDLGVFDSRFVLYRLKAPATHGDDEALSVETSTGDAAVAFTGDERLPGAQGKRASTFSMPTAAASDRPIYLLFENGGHPNGGADMELRRGVREVRVVPVGSVGREIGNWRMLKVDSAENRPEVAPDFDDAKWRKIEVDRSEGRMRPTDKFAVYRAAFDVTPQEIAAGPKRLLFGRIDDKGWVYLDGKQVAHTNDWSQPQSVDLGKELKAGHHVVAVVVQNDDGPGGLAQGVNLEPASAAGRAVDSMDVATDLVSSRERWWDPATDESKWTKSTSTDDANAKAQPMLRWYRLHFKLPAPQPHVWAPWRFKLQAVGNGFLYLNGHALGRYWQVGPQEDFYLPECWLHTDDKTDNVLTICLRPTHAAPTIRGAELSVYETQAERR
jgi:hypothetical protein